MLNKASKSVHWQSSVKFTTLFLSSMFRADLFAKLIFLEAYCTVMMPSRRLYMNLKRYLFR